MKILLDFDKHFFCPVARIPDTQKSLKTKNAVLYSGFLVFRLSDQLNQNIILLQKV